MSDETDAAQVGEQGGVAVAEAPDWRAAVDSAPAEELRKHPRFAGILGSELQAVKQREQAAADRKLLIEKPEAYRDTILERERANDQFTATDTILKGLYDALPEAAQKELRGMHFETGDAVEDRRLAVAAATRLLTNTTATQATNATQTKADEVAARAAARQSTGGANMVNSEGRPAQLPTREDIAKITDPKQYLALGISDADLGAILNS